MDDLERLTADLTRGAHHALDLAEVAVHKSIADVEATAKTIVPVDTGFLRSSIGSDVQRGHGYVQGQTGPTAEYGEYVEHGTARQAPQAYMGPALDRHSSAFEQAIAQIGERLL